MTFSLVLLAIESSRAGFAVEPMQEAIMAVSAKPPACPSLP
jgi:hypothetical protein